jgi:hypothetical protein
MSDLPAVVFVVVNLSKTINYTLFGITFQKTAVFIIVSTFSSIVTFELIAENI